MSAIAAMAMINTFPSITSLIMCGVAGGVPSPENPDDHVRLGDVVISDKRGVIEYDQIKDNSGRLEYRASDPRPASELLKGASLVRDSTYPWQNHIAPTDGNGRKLRPADHLDVLYSDKSKKKEIDHPHQPNRHPSIPMVHYGNVGSANILLKNTKRREFLKTRFSLKAVEMEGSGLAKASWALSRGYLIVRGICDYANEHKNGVWHRYAADVAAAMTIAIVQHLDEPNSAKIRPRSKKRRREEKV